MHVQQDSHIFNARVHIFKAPDVRAIIGLQDVRADSTFNICKMYGQTAIVQRWPC
jgi:hypothetical protein